MQRRRCTLSSALRGLRLAALTATVSVGIAVNASHAGVMMEGFYWNVPSPAAGNSGAPYWWDHLSAQAHTLALDGFSAIWLPPCLKGASGGYSVGYDPFDDYDLGSKNQQGTTVTRYGSRQSLEKCCAMLHANGLQLYMDMVNQHRNGYTGNESFQYTNAYGAANAGRFPKSSTDFFNGSNQDPYVWDGNNPAFTPATLPVNGGTPSGWSHSWMWVGLEQAGDWLTKALDLNGYRFDYVKGISATYLKDYVSNGSYAMAGKFSVGEFFDGNLSNCQTYQSNSGWMNNQISLFDFPLHDNYLYPMCMNPGGFNMASLDHAGLTGVNPAGAVTFVENHDTDNGGGTGAITQNKLLAYAYILTSEGYPCVFYRDWSTDSGCYGSGMQSQIDNLVWIHEKIASGSTTQRWKNGNIFAYERLGGSHLLVGLNTASSAWTITCATGFGANVQLHDYTGHEPDVWTDGSGNATITIPALNGGLGYVCYSRAGIGGSFSAPQNSTTQEYAGASDLDIYPADNTTLEPVSQIWAGSGKTISTSFYYDTTSWTSSTYIYLELDNPSGTKVASQNFYSGTTQGSGFTYSAPSTGFYTFKVRSYNTPSGNAKPSYWLKATYTSSQQ